MSEVPETVEAPKRRGGRKAGVPNRVTLAARVRITEEADPVGKLIEAAKTGRVTVGDETRMLDTDQWLGVIRELRRMTVPDAKTEHGSLTLPLIVTPEDALRARALVVEAVTAGRLATEDGLALAQLVDGQREALATVKLAEELRELRAIIEARNGNGGALS